MLNFTGLSSRLAKFGKGSCQEGGVCPWRPPPRNSGFPSSNGPLREHVDQWIQVVVGSEAGGEGWKINHYREERGGKQRVLQLRKQNSSVQSSQSKALLGC